jgi:gas vesicle structural protein
MAIASRELRSERSLMQRDVSLLDLLDRVLDRGVVIDGEIVLAVADVDLVRLDLRLLLGAIDTLDAIENST